MSYHYWQARWSLLRVVQGVNYQAVSHLDLAAAVASAASLVVVSLLPPFAHVRLHWQVFVVLILCKTSL